MASFRDSRGLMAIPNKLVREITACTPFRDLLALCRTSRHLRAHCIPWIFRSLALNDAAGLVKCFKTLILNTEAAESVRELEISFSPSRPLKSFYTTIHRAIIGLKNLRVLKVLRSRSIFHLFAGMHFPQLCDLEAPASADIFPFLESHSALLRYLSILPSADEITTSLTFEQDPFAIFALALPKQPICMSQLRLFSGPSKISPVLVPGSPISRINIFWVPNQIASVEECVIALVQSSAEVVELGNGIFGWDRTLLSAVAARMPQLKCLGFRNYSTNNDLAAFEEFIGFLDFVITVLPSFPSLTHLDLLDGAPPKEDELNEADALTMLDRDFGILQQWGEKCPTLARVTLPVSHIRWSSVEGLWFPEVADAISAATGDGELAMRPLTMYQFKWLFHKALELPGIYRALADYLAGEEGMREIENHLMCHDEIADFEFVKEPDGVYNAGRSRIRLLISTSSSSSEDADSEISW